MFDIFKTRKGLVDEYKMPESPEAAPKADPVTYYSLGPTDNNRISLKMGYSSITMNKAGAQAMINLLTTAMNQLTDEDETE